MVATAIALHLRAKSRLVSNPRFPLLFSTSSSSSTNSNVEPHDGPTSSQSQSQSQPDSASSSSSYFNDIKAKLRQPSHQQPQREQPDRHQPFPISSRGPSSPGTPNVASIEEIRRNLSEFQRRASPPPPYQSSSTTPRLDPISFQGLYDRSLISKGGESIGEARMSFDSIRERLKRINKNRPAGDRTTAIQQLSKFKESFNLKPADPLARGPSSTLDRTNNLPPSVFKKEMKEQGRVESPPIKSEFMRMYSYDQLGDKLKKLRPDTKPENWFSIKELNERLVKLREMEKKETESMVSGQIYYDLKESVQKIVQEVEKKKPPSVQRLDIISHINETPFYMLKPPKEQLFEKYLHPDNMSSSELMKLELAKVRDEFKMSESDCGSARVQVAQLTTKIKHLSKVLHKKDKHSRKGLIEMVERRKKLLKYLRRTDWDSYCLVLSKLGLRDKPTEKGLIKR